MASNFGCIRTNNDELRIVILGKTGIGKSATGNTILGRQCFESRWMVECTSVDCSKCKAVVDGQQVAVIDTPELFDTRFGKDKTIKDISQCISYAAPGPHVFLVVIRLGRFTEEEKQSVQRIQEIFGQAADRYCMVLFTGGDLHDDMSIEEFLDGSSDLQELVAKCNGQYHVFNNKLKDRSQVTELLQKIRNIVQRNGGSHYTNEMFQEAERAIEEEKKRILAENEKQIRKQREEMERKLKEKYEKEMKKLNELLWAERDKRKTGGCIRTNKQDLRIVILGKTGTGRSATGNTILGQQCFESKFSLKSTTVDCSQGKAVVDGQQVAVIDTPGLFNTRFDMDKTAKDIRQCISYAAPGPHVFLVVIRLGRFTEEEKQSVQRIQEIFGQAADRYCMVLFTGGDLLEGTSVEKLLADCSDLKGVVTRCNGQYHVFNNKLKGPSQVTELLQKIRDTVQRNGGSHYTNEMLQEAERAVENSKERILEEKEKQIRKEREELEWKLKEKYEKEMKEFNAQLEAEREERQRRA